MPKNMYSLNVPLLDRVVSDIDFTPMQMLPPKLIATADARSCVSRLLDPDASV